MSDQEKDTNKPFLVIVTGLSGAGLSSAIKALEDHGFYCIDNLPVELIESAVALMGSGRHPARGFAFGMDIRDKRFAREFLKLKERLAQYGRLDVVFLSADEAVLATRFGATRRRHPLLEHGGSLVNAIQLERELLQPVEEAADVVFDTSTWSPHHLARVIEQRYGAALPARNLYVTITSFGFKYGQLRPLDSLYDVRFLRNPHFVPELKAKTGLNPAVRDYVLADPLARVFLQKLEDMHRFLLPNYYREGKHYFRIGIACTGGRHRSVCFAEELAQTLRAKPIDNVVVSVMHRDIDHPVMPLEP